MNDGARFGFGANWAGFLARIDEARIVQAERSLQDMLCLQSLEGLTFVDVGCGSGLFSLAAARLGASRVQSFDFDAGSVACTQELKRRYLPQASNWLAEQGSALDQGYLKNLGTFDIVYSWGVLHHTGDMWRALDYVAGLTADHGRLFVTIYNDQGLLSSFWKRAKHTFNTSPSWVRVLMLNAALIGRWALPSLRDLVKGRPFSSWRNYDMTGRGMSAWTDLVDWMGGYPYEVAKPEQIFDFYTARGFRLLRLQTQGGGNGCNQFVFGRHQASSVAER